jgi:MYXO-CTERM domain-containing protein
VSISSMSVSLVPAPGAIALVGLAGLVGRRRR